MRTFKMERRGARRVELESDWQGAAPVPHGMTSPRFGESQAPVSAGGAE